MKKLSVEDELYDAMETRKELQQQGNY